MTNYSCASTYDVKSLEPYLYDHPNQRAIYYPDGRDGLTQARKKDRLTHLTAYTVASGQLAPYFLRTSDLPPNPELLTSGFVIASKAY